MHKALDLIQGSRSSWLIDLSGATRGTRPELLAARPSPLQIFYLGTLVTTGASYMQYHVTDRVALSPSIAPVIVEKAVLLPFTYQAIPPSLSLSPILS